jgi:hypothetical protein
MSTDPVRLMSDPACPESQRELLQLGAGIEPPHGAEARVWLALAGAVGAASAGGAAAADASAKTITTTATGVKTGLASLKLVAIVAGLTGLAALVALGNYLFSAKASAPRPLAAALAPAVEPPASTPPPSPAAAAVEPALPDDRPPPAEAAPARPQPGPRRAVRSPARRLGEETTLIRDARQALRAGDARRALRLLEESRRLFPTGVLEQERERLMIEALVKAGRGAEASARASAFLRKYPDSPHAGEIRALGTSGGR